MGFPANSASAVNPLVNGGSRARKGSQSILGILGGMAKSLSKVLAGYVLSMIVLGTVHYQRQVDDRFLTDGL